VATAAGDNGVGVAGLDAVRRKTVLRRDETEPARASMRRQVAGGLERSEHGVAVDGVGGRRAARLAVGSRALVSCASSNGSRACQRKRSISACGAKTYSPRWQRCTQRSMSASRRFLFKLRRRASSNAGHAHFVLAAQQRASAAEFDLGLQKWSSSA
jgi:hypothetical protein